MEKETGKLLKYIVKEVVLRRYRPEILKILSANKINRQYLKSLLSYHDLAPFLHIILKNNHKNLPQDFRNFLKNVYYSHFHRYLNLWEEFLKITRKAKKENILIIPIKGLSFSEHFYKDYGFRPIVDIDLLIKEENLDRGVELLENLGYKKYLLGATEKYWRKEHYHLEFLKRNKYVPCLAELHWSLDFKRGKKVVLPSLWKRLKKVKMDGEELYVLSKEDTIFSLLLHQRHFGKMFNLKYICDMGIILKNNLNWNYIFEIAKKEKCQASLFFLLAQTTVVLDINLEKYLNKINISLIQKKLIYKLIRKCTYLCSQDFNPYYIYIICHLLLYDNIKEPLEYILNIPQEQFAKFYKLPVYAPRTKKLYKLRYLYSPYRLIKDLLNKNLLKPNPLKNLSSCLSREGRKM